MSFLLGIGAGVGQPLSMTMVFNASPKGREGEAAGMRITVNQIAHFVIPLFFGAVGSAAGYAAVPCRCSVTTPHSSEGRSCTT